MTIYIPIRGPELVKYGYEELEGEYSRFLNDFGEFKNTEDLRKLIDDEGKHQNFEGITFSIIYSSKTTNEEIEEIASIRSKYSFFKVDFIGEFLKIELDFVEWKDEENQFTEIISNDLITKLALLINLTYSTKIDFLAGIIFSKARKYIGKTKVLLSTLDFSYEHAKRIRWPVIKSLELNDTLSWFISNGLHTNYSSKNKLHRAINAFSYQFSNLHEKDTSKLFWTMVGIEALLAEGVNNVMGQIKSKSSIILGQPVEYKKKLDKLYNYRSRFVHGDIDFPAKFSSDYDNFESEYWDYLHFANSILLALIRTLVVMKKDAFEFEYRMKGF